VLVDVECADGIVAKVPHCMRKIARGKMLKMEFKDTETQRYVLLMPRLVMTSVAGKK
jgi:hypothetical protein